MSILIVTVIGIIGLPILGLLLRLTWLASHADEKLTNAVEDLNRLTASTDQRLRELEKTVWGTPSQRRR